jgi:hypothetical protein
MVGYRAGMGEVLLGRKQLTAARRLRVNRVILTVVRPLTSGLPRSTDILWLSRKVGFVPTHKVAALQPAARGQEPRDRKPAERTALARLKAPS